ncbi:MAG: NADPH:quinone oxidoreductase family protein [Betaproteobacteria bacterium]|nr:NADPH:quinone oxidoreductase family protein [Betaproteobacteria bacterium]
MRAWCCTGTGGLQDLALAEVPQPTAGADEVVVRVAAGALNFSDLLMLRGAYQVRPPLPFVPGQEIAGTVRVDSARFRQGDRVAGKVLWGGFAEQAVAREDMLIGLPQDVTFAEGASLPVIWPTAWIALHERARLLEGETVLVHAAAGGVGAAAMQLARAAGARVFATAGGDDKLALCRALGAEAAFDYRAGPWLEPLLAHTGGRGVDVVFDPVGGEITEFSVKALARNGRLLIVGFSGGAIPVIKANRLLLKNASALGVYWSHDTDAALVARALADVLALRTAGRVRLLVGQHYPFAELPRALADLEARRTTGKSVIVIEQTSE